MNKKIREKSINSLMKLNKALEKSLNGVDEEIIIRLDKSIPLINDIGKHLINASGKRLRPLLTLAMAAQFNDYSKNPKILAAAVEFIHTATLLHDDVVDESTMRRGRETANAIFGNQASVLVGDFLYTRSFQMMVELQSMRVMEILSDSTNRIAQGEVQQLMNCNDPDTTEASYFDVIYGKTARLFEAATQLAAVITGQSDEIEQAMQAYGRHLGTAFQLADDILDYESDSDAMGKNAGDDLAEGKPTLPLLYAMWHAGDEDAALIREAIEEANGLPHLQRIVTVMNDTGALNYTRQKAFEEADMAISALNVLPPSDYKQALIALAHIAVDRNS